MSWPILVALALVAVLGTAVVLTRNPHRQLFAMSASGIALTLLFWVLQAPDVAISETGVGAVIVPLLFLIALSAIDNADREQREAQPDAPEGDEP